MPFTIVGLDAIPGLVFSCHRVMELDYSVMSPEYDIERSISKGVNVLSTYYDVECATQAADDSASREI
jgi:hypothetical protein